MICARAYSDAATNVIAASAPFSSPVAPNTMHAIATLTSATTEQKVIFEPRMYEGEKGKIFYVMDIYPSREMFVEQKVFVRVEYNITINVHISKLTSALPTSPASILTEMFAE